MGSLATEIALEVIANNLTSEDQAAAVLSEVEDGTIAKMRDVMNQILLSRQAQRVANADTAKEAARQKKQYAELLVKALDDIEQQPEVSKALDNEVLAKLNAAYIENNRLLMAMFKELSAKRDDAKTVAEEAKSWAYISRALLKVSLGRHGELSVDPEVVKCLDKRTVKDGGATKEGVVKLTQHKFSRSHVYEATLDGEKKRWNSEGRPPEWLKRLAEQEEDLSPYMTPK